MQVEKQLQNLKNLKDSELIDRLVIMTEGMVEVAGGVENSPTAKILRRILDAIKPQDYGKKRSGYNSPASDTTLKDKTSTDRPNEISDNDYGDGDSGADGGK